VILRLDMHNILCYKEIGNSIYCIKIMKNTFADESWRGNSWSCPIILAHVPSDNDLAWFFELIKRRQNKNGELKANEALRILNNLDIRQRSKIWQSLQNVIIIINDPKQYLSNLGIRILNGVIFQFEYQKKHIKITPQNESYNSFLKLLQDTLSRIILLDSPASDIYYSMSEISYCIDIYPIFDEDDFYPYLILEKMDKEDPRKRIINVKKLSARLHSAFFELKDPQTQEETLKKVLPEERRYFNPSYYYSELLYQSISPARFFDEGDRLSIKIIKELQEKINQGLQQFNKYTLPSPKIIELDSKKDIRIQAADVAAGIARDVYECHGIKGLRDKFNYVFVNERKI